MGDGVGWLVVLVGWWCGVDGGVGGVVVGGGGWGGKVIFMSNPNQLS